MTMRRWTVAVVLASVAAAASVSAQPSQPSTPGAAPASGTAPAAPAEAAETPTADAPSAAPAQSAPAADAAPSTPETASSDDGARLSLSTSDLNAGPGSAQRFSAGVLLGAGFTFDENVGGVNPLGFGLGVRGGYHCDRWFFGGRLLFYLGGSSQLPTGEVSMSSWLLAAEAGYDFHFGEITVQPGLALGLFSRSIDGPPFFLAGAGSGAISGAQDDTDLSLYVAPGASLLVPLSVLVPDLDAFFVGGDARLGFAIDDAFSGHLELLATAGLRF